MADVSQFRVEVKFAAAMRFDKFGILRPAAICLADGVPICASDEDGNEIPLAEAFALEADE